MRNRAAVILLVALLLLTGSTYYLMRQAANTGEKGLVVKASGEKLCTIDISRLQSLPARDFSYRIRINGRKETHEFTGTALKNVLEACNPDLLHDYRQVIVTARDGYTISYDMSEVLEEDNIYLIYAMDGKILKPQPEGGIGPFATAVLKDEFARRAGKYVVSVEAVR